MSAVDEGVHELATDEDFKTKVHYFIECFEKACLESDREDQKFDLITDFLKSIKICCYKTGGGECTLVYVIETIQNRVDECVEKIAEMKQGEIMDGLNYFEIRKHHLEWLLNMLVDATYDSVLNNIVSLPIPLRRCSMENTTVLEIPVSEEKFKLEKVKMAEVLHIAIDNILDLAKHIEIDDMKNDMDKMPRDEYEALLRSKAEKFEWLLENFESENLTFVTKYLERLGLFMEHKVNGDPKNLTKVTIEVIKRIQRFQGMLNL